MIQVNNLSKGFAGQILFENVTFNLPSKARVGLVGRNGAGKSTIFKLILGQESPDEGVITYPKNYTIGSLNQHINFNQSTILQEVMSALAEEKKYETFRAEKILSGLGFSQDDLNKSPLSFSGGYQIRINLAKVLITGPNLLLLDEPTNYLDIVSLRWLKNFLNTFDGEVIIITHDQEFMDSVTNHIMGLHRKQLRIFKGDTAQFYSKLIADEEIYEKTRQNQEKKRKEMERFVERFKAKASKATQAQSKLKQLQKMEQLEELSNENDLEFSFNYKELNAKKLLEVQHLSFGYEPSHLLFKDISFAIGQRECIAIIGKNGKGKSTLLNCLAKEINAQGKIHYHPNLSISHFGQTNIKRLNEELSIVEEIASVSPDLSHTRIRQICGVMMFPGELADKKIKVLSGGERSRVMLGKILAKPSNILFLDEPTNHLDMQSIESLSEAIEDFPGATLIVTHSEMLLKRLATRLIIFHHDKAEYFHGNYQDFLEKIGWEDEELGKKQRTSVKTSKKELQKARAVIIKERSKELGPLKLNIERLENLIHDNETLIAQKNEELVKASEESDVEKINSLSKKISDLQNEIDYAFDNLDHAQTEFDDKFNFFEEKLNELE